LFETDGGSPIAFKVCAPQCDCSCCPSLKWELSENKERRAHYSLIRQTRAILFKELNRQCYRRLFRWINIFLIKIRFDNDNFFQKCKIYKKAKNTYSRCHISTTFQYHAPIMIPAPYSTPHRIIVNKINPSAEKENQTKKIHYFLSPPKI